MGKPHISGEPLLQTSGDWQYALFVVFAVSDMQESIGNIDICFLQLQGLRNAESAAIHRSKQSGENHVAGCVVVGFQLIQPVKQPAQFLFAEDIRFVVLAALWQFREQKGRLPLPA